MKKSLRVVNDLDTAQPLGIKPGQKLCPTCLKKGKAIENKCDTESLKETNKDLYESHEDPMKSLTQASKVWVVLQLKPVTYRQNVRTVAEKNHRLLVQLK